MATGSSLVFASSPRLHPERVWRMIDAFTDTAVVRVNPKTGMTLQCMSKAQNAILEWNIAPEEFTSFECARPRSFGVVVVYMLRILRGCGLGSVVEWDFSDDDTLHIDVRPSAADAEKGAHTAASYELRMVNVESEMLQCPEKDWVCASVRTPQFFRVVSHLYGLVDEISQITMSRAEDGKLVRCEASASSLGGRMAIPTVDGFGEDTAGGEDEDEDADADADEAGAAAAAPQDTAYASKKLMYDAKILRQVLDAASSIAPFTAVRWACGCPLYLSFTTDPSDPDEASNCGRFKIFIAPHLDDDDDDGDESDA